jgi:hypothetical protein
MRETLAQELHDCRWSRDDAMASRHGVERTACARMQTRAAHTGRRRRMRFDCRLTSASRVRELIMSPSAHAPRRCAAAVAHGCSCWQTFAMARWPPVAGAVPPSGRWSGGGASRCGEPTIGGVVRAPTTAPSAALLSDSEMRSCANQANEGRKQLAIGSRAIKRLRSEVVNGLVRQSMTRRGTGHVTA